MTELAIVPQGEFDVDDMMPDPQGKLVWNAHRRYLWWVGHFDGVPGCVWGVVPKSLLSDQCYLWMANNEVLTRHSLAFARASRIVVAEILEHWHTVYGHCSDSRAERFLQFLGAKLGPPDQGMTTFIIRRSL